MHFFFSSYYWITLVLKSHGSTKGNLYFKFPCSFSVCFSVILLSLMHTFCMLKNELKLFCDVEFGYFVKPPLLTHGY